MTSHQLLGFLLAGSFDRVADLTQAPASAWSEPAVPNLSPVGFTAWHCARTLDWTFQCAIRGVDEVAVRPGWRERMPEGGRFGAGVTRELALEIPRQVGPGVVAAYNDAVRTESLAWLEEQSEAALDAIPDFRAHQERAGYMRPEVWEEIGDLEGIPTWQLLLRPSMAHIRVHYGEAEVLLQLSGQTSE